MEFDNPNNHDNNNSKSNNEFDSSFLFNLCSSKNEPKASATNCVQISSKRDDLYYNMDNKCHGRCIILNYEQFDSQELTRRRGTESD
ncbi:caspase-like protein, partial [Euroglyphus maynei]